MKSKIVVQDVDKLDIALLLKENGFAGKIAVVYKESDHVTADIIVRGVEASGTLVKRLAYPKDVLVNEGALSDLLLLPEEIRFVVAIGDRSISEITACCERDYILILTGLNTAEFLSPSVMLDGRLDNLSSKAPKAVVVDRVSLSDSQRLAKAYACIIAHYAILPDLWFNNCFGAVDIKYLEGIDKTLSRLAVKPIERNSADTIDRIIKANIDLAELNASATCDRTVFSSLRLTAMDITQDLDAVEIGALWTVYLYQYLSKLLPMYGENLRYPSDLVSLAENLSRQSGIENLEIMRRITSWNVQSILTRDYVLIEYKGDICHKINEKAEQITISLKQLKRLYDDAGQKLSGAVNISQFKGAILASSVVTPGYSLTKHLCLMGILG